MYCRIVNTSHWPGEFDPQVARSREVHEILQECMDTSFEVNHRRSLSGSKWLRQIHMWCRNGWENQRSVLVMWASWNRSPIITFHLRTSFLAHLLSYRRFQLFCQLYSSELEVNSPLLKRTDHQFQFLWAELVTSSSSPEQNWSPAPVHLSTNGGQFQF